MADNPRQVLASVAADETEPFDYTGPAAVFIRDDLEGGRAVIEYVVSTPDGATVRAYGEGPGIVPGPCGSTLRLTGRRLGDRAALSSAIVVGQAAGDTCGSAGEQRMAILMLYRAGVDPPKVTPEQVEGLRREGGQQYPQPDPELFLQQHRSVRTGVRVVRAAAGIHL
jgi:hypothetical protein